MTTTDEFTASVAGAVRAELSRRQRPISEVAAAIGVSRTTLSKLINGGGSFDLAQLAAIADYLEIPVEQIFESARLGNSSAVAS